MGKPGYYGKTKQELIDYFSKHQASCKSAADDLDMSLKSVVGHCRDLYLSGVLNRDKKSSSRSGESYIYSLNTNVAEIEPRGRSTWWLRE